MLCACQSRFLTTTTTTFGNTGIDKVTHSVSTLGVCTECVCVKNYDDAILRGKKSVDSVTSFLPELVNRWAQSTRFFFFLRIYLIISPVGSCEKMSSLSISVTDRVRCGIFGSQKRFPSASVHRLPSNGINFPFFYLFFLWYTLSDPTRNLPALSPR